MTAAERIAPDSALAGAAYRAWMVPALVASARSRSRPARALAAALRATAAGRIPPEERAWIDRIESYRRLLPSTTIADAPDALGRPPCERLAEARMASRYMSIPPALGRLLLRVVRELAPRSSLELGTGFGVSSAYQAAALELNGSGTITSLDIEGMVAIARPGLERLGLGDRVELVGGAIEETLVPQVRRRAPVDYALLDADHTERGTLAAFEALLPGLADEALVVLDDVNWTAEMRRAWRRVREHPRVGAAVGLRRLGFAVIEARR